MSNEQTEPKKGFVARIDGTKFAIAHPELWKFIKALGVGTVISDHDIPLYIQVTKLCRHSQS